MLEQTYKIYCIFHHTVYSENFVRVLFSRNFAYVRSFVKIKSSRIGKITLSFTDMGISCPSHEYLMSQICILTIFPKIKFLQKFLDLQYVYSDTLLY